VEFPASLARLRAGRGFSRTHLRRKSDFVPSLCQVFHEPLTSWASHRGHSQPGPRWDAQDHL